MKQNVVKINAEDLPRISNEVDNIASVVKEIGGQIDNLLISHSAEIWKAYKANASELTVNFSVKLKGDGGNVFIQSGISFTAEKITDSLTALVKMNQPRLPLTEEER